VAGRSTSGDEGLDRILGGGLPMNGINLIMGLPGSGKTILCQQFIFAGATEERPAIYLSTVSEPFEKILRYAQTLSFFDRPAIGRSVFYEDLGPAVSGDDGLAAVTERIAALIKERRPGIIAIDSFKALAAFAPDAREFRRFLHNLAALLTAFPATSFWIGEYSEDETRTAPEFAVADGIISLARERMNQRTLRLIEVTKLRGSDFRSGRHTYRLSRDGITVFPRLADPVRQDDYRLSEARISTGIAPLDRMLAEGYGPGSSTLVAGPSGSGKTLMGLHFIFSGAANDQPGLIATLQENPIQLEKVARGFGWSLDNERVTVMYRSPNDVYVDQWVYELLDLVDSTGAKRVMIDSLSDLQYATPDPVRFREFIYSLTQRLSRAGISPIMTSEIPDLFHVGRLAESGISHLSDNVVLLQYLRADARLLRTVTILKSRASAHDPEIREFEITPDGIVLGDPIAGDHA
jgi:circadian clock protein KaiC